MTYVIRRGAVYYLNLRLPKHLFPYRHTLRLSLDVRDRKNAVFLASALTQRVHLHITAQPLTTLEQLRVLCTQWREGTPAPASPISSNQPARSTVPTTTVGSSPLLSTLSKTYMEEGQRGGIWREVSDLDIQRALRDFFELMGDMPANHFTTETARTLKERLGRLPQYFAQRPEFKGMTLRQVVDSAKDYQTITAVTVNNRLRKLTAFFNWCQSNGYIEQNPLVGMKVMAGAAKDARLSFDRSDLQVLLKLDTLHQEARKHPWRLWLPLLARLTGARLEELCQLHIDDVITVQGIPCIRIDDSRGDQKLKNHSSRRVLPIHPTLLGLGLLRYVESVQEKGASRIFPELVPTRGKYGHAPSKWFSRFKQKLGITDPRKTFHSFRHTFIDDLREAGVQDSLIKRMVGHEDSAVTFGVYGSRIPLKAMQKALTFIQLDQIYP
ncbi:site-specific integrase [Pseudomonas citronellolis]|uniref:site-specific integrase n=1 Tax=Pseudomonas citronellolis TaxID=53408 RepID=UPI002110FEDB|nr:site-specific integrase [Pseudomonas citronellolis]UUC48125.1 site-specific integrase [Pseudomonas citronellolis]